MILALSIFGIILTAVVCVLILVSGFVYYSSQNSADIYSGVWSAGIDLGELSMTEAALQLHQKWNIENQIVASNGIDTVLSLPAGIGLELDALATAERAYSVGRVGSFIERIGTILDVRMNDIEIEPIVKFDEQLALSGLLNLSPGLSRAAVEAQFIYKDGEIHTTSGEIGYAPNMTETIAFIRNNSVPILFSSTLPIQLMPLVPEVMDLTEVSKEGNKILAARISLVYFDPIINERFEKDIPPELKAAWLTVKVEGKTPKFDRRYLHGNGVFAIRKRIAWG